MTIERKSWIGFGALILVFVDAGLIIGGSVWRIRGVPEEIIGVEKLTRLSVDRDLKKKRHLIRGTRPECMRLWLPTCVKRRTQHKGMTRLGG
jgi:hypothetical protein